MLMAMNRIPVPVIADIIGSRGLDDRNQSQGRIVATLFRVSEVIPPNQKWTPTVGDEFQGAYASVPDALRATLLIHLLLPTGLDLRFGIGQGDIRSIEPEGRIQDGPGWWAAREAIERAHRLGAGSGQTLRSWFCRDPSQDDVGTSESTINSYLTARDFMVTSLSERSRNIGAALLQGKTQAVIATELDITQSAVSQTIRRHGFAALKAGWDALTEEGTC
jgi:DNA-binding CsgD family transcriptional regulator